MSADVSSRILAAATLAEQAAEDLEVPPDDEMRVWDRFTLTQSRQQFLDDGYEPGAVAEALRAMVELHAALPAPDPATGRTVRCRCGGPWEPGMGEHCCRSLAALLPLVDQIIRDLGDGQ